VASRSLSSGTVGDGFVDEDTGSPLVDDLIAVGGRFDESDVEAGPAGVVRGFGYRRDS